MKTETAMRELTKKTAALLDKYGKRSHEQTRTLDERLTDIEAKVISNLFPANVGSLRDHELMEDSAIYLLTRWLDSSS